MSDSSRSTPPAQSALGDEQVRLLVPQVLATLLRRGEDFEAAEDALQEALIEALRTWRGQPPRDARAWLTTVATRRLVDVRRSESARRRREQALGEQALGQQAPAGATEQVDDTLLLLFRCCHPALTAASAVALTLRAVAGLTTAEIAAAFLVPEATMAQRISRAKATLRGQPLDRPGNLPLVLNVLYLIYGAGHAGRVDLAEEAIRLVRQLTTVTDDPEAAGLLALMLLHHARLPARFDDRGQLVPLDEQDRRRWNGAEIAEGVTILRAALAREPIPGAALAGVRPGRYQLQAAIAALHDDAATAAETDWPQILQWYDDLLAGQTEPYRDDPAAALSRAVAVGHVHGPEAGQHEVDRVVEQAPTIRSSHRVPAVRGYLFELAGDLAAAASEYARAADRARSVPERTYLISRAATVRAGRSRRALPESGSSVAGPSAPERR